MTYILPAKPLLAIHGFENYRCNPWLTRDYFGRRPRSIDIIQWKITVIQINECLTKRIIGCITIEVSDKTPVNKAYMIMKSKNSVLIDRSFMLKKIMTAASIYPQFTLQRVFTIT